MRHFRRRLSRAAEAKLANVSLLLTQHHRGGSPEAPKRTTNLGASSLPLFRGNRARIVHPQPAPLRARHANLPLDGDDMNRALILGILAFVLTVPGAPSLLAQANPRIGTWKLTVAKSKYEGTSVEKSETRTYVAAAGGAISLNATAVLADGTRQTTSFTAKYDGKPYPYKSASADTIKIVASDGYVTDSTMTKGGKPVQTSHATVSKDGKTLTLMTKGTNSMGKAFSSTRVYDKQ